MVIGPFMQCAAESIECCMPGRRVNLPEEPHCRVPGSVSAAEHPAPVRRILNQRPDGFSQSPCKMGDGCIDSYHKIKLLYQRRSVRKVLNAAGPVGHPDRCRISPPFAD